MTESLYWKQSRSLSNTDDLFMLMPIQTSSQCMEIRQLYRWLFNSPYAGPNGIRHYCRRYGIECKNGNRQEGNITFTMNVMGVGVSATATIQMLNGTNQCTATINPNFNSNRITFRGNLYQKQTQMYLKESFIRKDRIYFSSFP